MKKDKMYHLLFIMMEVQDLMIVGEVATLIRPFIL